MEQFRDCDRALASKQRQNIVEHWCCDALLVGGLDKDGSWIGSGLASRRVGGPQYVSVPHLSDARALDQILL